MTTLDIVGLRTRLRLSRQEFAQLAGVDAATVWRWEVGHAAPRGSAAKVLAGLSQGLEAGEERADRIIELVVGAIAMGGLAYLIFKLLTDAGASE